MAEGGGLEVSGAGLDAFAGEVDNRTSYGFRPAVTSAMESYRLGTQFGNGLAMVSSTLQETRKKYQGCLETGSVTLAEYVRASEILVNAIRQVQRNYGSADAAAAAGNDAVLAKAMSEASRAVGQRREAGERSWRAAGEANDHGAGAPVLPGEYNL